MPEPSKYYHIFNRANGWEKMFFTEENYRYFLRRYMYFVTPVVHTLAYCLMPNHLHFLVKIKSEKELKEFFGGGKREQQTFRKFQQPRSGELSESFGTGGAGEKELQLLISKQFSKLFSSYTQSFNKVFKRKGSLFIPNFKRKEIDSYNYLQQIVIYIHNNPVKHSYVARQQDWKFSSYNDIVSGNHEWIKGNETIKIFNNLENFTFVHQQKQENTFDFQ